MVDHLCLLFGGGARGGRHRKDPERCPGSVWFRQRGRQRHPGRPGVVVAIGRGMGRRYDRAARTVDRLILRQAGLHVDVRGVRADRLPQPGRVQPPATFRPVDVR
jgi:hypothetical protein